MFRKILSLTLSICLLATSLPLQAIAETLEETVVPETVVYETTVPETTVPETVVHETAAAETTVTVETEPTVEETSVPTEAEETLPATEPEETVGEEVAEEAAATLIASGYCGKGGLKPGENLQYAFYSDGALYITGYGEMKDYATILDLPPWGKTYGNNYPLVTSVSLPEGLVNIGNCAFYGSAFESVEIPSTVTKIGTHAFYMNGELQNVTILGDVVSIGEYAFNICRSLAEINWPSSLMEIGESAFNGCDALKTVDIPNVVSLGKWAFAMCVAMEECNLSENLTYIPEYAFYGCDALKGIHIPDKVLSIGDSAFLGSGLEEITVPGSVLQLGNSVFQGCSALKEASISNAVKDLPSYTFSNCSSLERVTCSDKLESIGFEAFFGCGALQAFFIPGTVKNIGGYAFKACRSLTEMTIPESEDQSAPRVYGDGIFSSCNELKTVTILDAMTSIPDSTFSGCNALETLVFPAEEKEDDPDGDGFMENKLPKTITAIGKDAFLVCSALDKIILPETLTSIGSSAFQYCRGLTAITIPESVTQYGNAIFRDCTALKDVTLPQSMTAMPNEMFFCCESIETIELPKNLVELGSSVFQSCVKLRGITLPDTLTTIGNSAFNRCNGFTEVQIPDNVSSIGKYAFLSCKNLEKIKLPVNGQFTVLDDGIFDGCNKLAEIDLPDTIVSIGSGAFRATALTEIDFPTAIRVIGSGAFQNCKGFLTFEFPDCVEKIDSYTFSGCTNLQNIIIHAAVKEIGSMAFNDCKALQDVYYSGTLDQWGGIIIGSGNAALTNARRHYGGWKDSGELEEGRRWALDLKNTLVISGKGAMKDYTETQPAPWKSYSQTVRRIEIREGITHIGDYSFENFTALEVLVLPQSLKSIGANAFLGCAALKKIQYMGTTAEWYAMDIDPEGNEVLNAAALKCILLVDHTVENQQIRIHRSGNATAWYRTTPNVEIGYTLAGDTDMQPTGPATSGPEGVFDVPLGHFGTPGTYEVIVKVHSIGEESYDPAIEMVANIQVTDLEFFQSWELKMEAKGSAGISKGVGGEIGALEAKAELAAIKGTANAGSVMNVTRNYSGGKNSLKVTSDRNMGIGVEVGSGIYAEAGGAKLDIARANLGVSGSAVESYGIRIDDFNYSPDQLKALGIYFLGESLVANPCSTYYVPLYRYLTDKYAYDKLGCTVISGFGTKVVGSASAGLGQIKVNDKALFSGVNGDFKATMSQMMKYSSTGEYEKTTSAQLTDSLAALTTSREISSGLKKNLLGKDIQVKATSSAGGKSLAIKSLVEREGAWDWNFSPKVEKTAEYISTVITDDSADGPMSQSPAFRHYLHDPSIFLSTLDMVQMAIAMAEWKLPTQYREETQHQTLSTIPDIALGASLGFSGKLAVTLSYMEKNGYTTGYGYNGVVTGESDEDTIEIEMRDKIFQIDKFIEERAIPALVEDASELYNTVVGVIEMTIETGKALIKGIKDSIYNWAVSLTVPNSGFTGSYSCQVKAIQQTSQMTANGISSVAVHNFDTVATIGDTILVAVQDLDTGMDVTDLSAEPLTLVLRYDEADLEAAGLTKESAVVLDGGIAMYRYSDEGDFFEFVGGENDLAAMTVTAQIVKPGQYVLAADSCAPQLSSLNLSDFREMPTITARIDDLSGLDVSKFVFKLDGAVKVDSSNVSQYLNSNTGMFTYAVTEALSEGEHSMSFTLADTTGNTQAYEYSFRIDLTAPVITETSITGATNENALVEVRAKISDENLEVVYAVFSKRNGDGTWSATASAEMAQLENGIWALDYVGDGSTVKVYIQAMDIAGNTAQSEAVEVHPFAESVQIEAEYIVLRENQSHTLSTVTAPAEFESQIVWTTENATIASVDENGVITGKNIGTTYVTATIRDGEKIVSDRVRVDVTEALDIEGVQLATTKATAELYKTDYTTLDILLKLSQNYSAQAENSEHTFENKGVAVESAKFTDETMAKYFDLVVLDDRTVQIIPTAEALANAKAVKSSYKGTVTVTVDGEPYETEMLTLSVKKTLPKLKATVAGFNSFYAGQAQPIVITGATVTDIKLDEGKKQPEWLTLKDGCLVLNEKAPAKSTSGKVYLLVETAEWAVPTALTLTVKNTYKVPGVKLATTSVTVSNQPGPAAVELKLVPTNKADTISGIGITGITAPEGYAVENFNEETGTFTLKAENGFKAGKIDLKVVFGNVTITLKLTVKTQAVKLKLSASKVSLNKDLGDVATVAVNRLTAGYDVTAPVLTYDAQMLNVQYENGKLTVSAKDAAYGKTYPVTVSAYQGAPTVKLTVAILKQNVAVKSTIKANGFVDVIRDGTVITVAPSYTNVLNVDVDNAAVLKIYTSADKFKNAIAEVKAEDGIFAIDKSVISDQILKYKAQLETVIGGTIVKSNLISLTVKMGTAKLTVKAEDTTLFSKDKNDRAMFWFEAADATLNGIARVEFKNAKQAAQFDLIDYGDGTWAIGFKDGKVDKSLVGKTVTVNLNVFIEGNQTAKANATANVKLTIVK